MLMECVLLSVLVKGVPCLPCVLPDTTLSRMCCLRVFTRKASVAGAPAAGGMWHPCTASIKQKTFSPLFPVFSNPMKGLQHFWKYVEALLSTASRESWAQYNQ